MFCSGSKQTVRGKGKFPSIVLFKTRRTRSSLCTQFFCYVSRLTRLLSVHTGAGTQAFCSGGDQTVRGKGGYVGEDSVPRLNVLDLQVQNPLSFHAACMN